MSEQLELLTRIDADLKQAMRDRNDVAKLALRAVKTALTEASKAGSDHVLTEEQVLAAIQKEAKRRRDAAAEYAKVGHTERAAQEEAELAILERYLPRQMSESEIEEIAKAVVADVGATSMRDMGNVMSAAMSRMAGRADGKLVNQVVRRILS